MIDIRTHQHVFVQCVDLVFCGDCKDMMFVAKQLQLSFLEANRIQLTEFEAEYVGVVINQR